MKITLFVSSVTVDADQPTQMSGCGIVLLAQEANQKKKRLFGFYLGGSSPHLAGVQALRLGLSSILPVYRKTPITLHVTELSVANLLVRDCDKFAEESDLEEVEKLRELYDNYQNLEMILDGSDDPQIAECYKLSQQCIDTKNNIDSGTLDVF